MGKQTDYSQDFIAFWQDLCPLDGPTDSRPIVPVYLTTFLKKAFYFDSTGHLGASGGPIARNIMDLRPKKQGKTALAAAVALFMASRKDYSEVVIAATDQDQSRDRVLRAAKYAVEHGPLANHAKIFRDTIEFDNRSIIQALSADYRGAAGGNYDAVIVDEAWAFLYESQRRLFDELVIPPTKPEGVRWISSYAGFDGESLLLRDWWDKALKGDKLDDDPPIYLNREASLLALVDVGEAAWRMPWMTAEYIQQVREAERPNTWRRLWLNEWVTSEGEFIPAGAWDECYDQDVKPIQPGEKVRLVLGADASTTRDLTALVGCTYDQASKTSQVRYVRVWKPHRGVLRMGKATVDLAETIGAEILRLHETGQLDSVFFDPYQLHSIALDLEKRGIRMKELPQTTARTEADQSLYDAIVSRSIKHYNDPQLNDAIRNCIAVESPRGFRIAKEKTSLKIDAAVALSMAHFGAVQMQSYGETTTMPNIFYGYADMPGKLAKAGNTWIFVDEDSPKKHRPGINWHNCPKCAAGCEACINELEAEGWYKKQAEADQIFIDNARLRDGE